MFTVVLATNRTAAFAAYDAAVSAKKAEGFPKTMWWAIITLTTVGYDDVVPATAIGKVVASVVALTGVAFIALPAGILGAGFIEEFEKMRNPSRMTNKN